MPELVTCPACGCSVQVSETLLGRQVRCIGCDHRFVAVEGRTTLPPWRRPPGDPPPRDEPRQKPPRPPEGDSQEGGRPLCPGCGRPISWEASRCPFCEEVLETEDATRRQQAIGRIRYDCEPHRARLIATLGNVSLFLGGLSLCTFGLGAAISLPVGIVAWIMANHDLEQMRSGHVDPRGKAQTETGRSGAVAGIILSLIFACFFAVIALMP